MALLACSVIILCILIGHFDNVLARTSSECPAIVPKDKWGGEPAIKIRYTNKPVEYVIVHHTVTSECSDENSCSKLLKSIQNYHITTKVYDDIAYNFLIGGDGKIYEGSGWHKMGAPNLPYNNRSLGVSFIGHFSDVLPNDKQLNGAKDLLKCGLELKELDYNYTLLGARQIKDTMSPGEKLYKELQNWSHFSKWP